MRKYMLLLAAAAMLAAPRAARAGFTAVTTQDAVLTPDLNGNMIADVGETLSTAPIAVRGMTSGGFASFLPDGPTDPQIKNNDLGLYGYQLDGYVSSIVGTNVTYAGNYKIQYFDPSSVVFDVSTGTFVIHAAFNGQGVADLDGLLTQTAGPSHPAFADLSYGFGAQAPVIYKGTYMPRIVGQGRENSGVIQGTLRQNGCIPEPGSMALLGVGLLPLLGLRRRK